jgi:hypothetical protein
LTVVLLRRRATGRHDQVVPGGPIVETSIKVAIHWGSSVAMAVLSEVRHAGKVKRERLLEREPFAVRNQKSERGCILKSKMHVPSGTISRLFILSSTY